MSIDKNIKSLKIIDQELGRQLVGNNINLANELLTDFIGELPNLLTQINTAHKQEDHIALQDSVHKLHGACCYCGVPRLKEVAAYLETALKTDEANINQLVQTINREIESVLDQSQNLGAP